MGLKVYGIVAAQNPDNAGETILIEGIDISRFNLIKDEHPEQENFFHSIGAIKRAKKIFSEKDCEDEKQLRCWRHAKVPFLYGEGELADDSDHPNAKSAAALLKFVQRDDIPLDVGWSIDGGIAERRTKDGQPTEDKELGKILAQTVALAGSLTVKPCNPTCVAFLENDLAKSAYRNVTPPANYLELLKKSRAKSSVVDSMGHTGVELFIKLQKLRKSVDDYFSAFTSMRCNRCAKPVRFFKSTKSMPNRCESCGSTYSMLDIWNAINK